MATILIAGFLHETNTFSPKPTTLHDFEQTLGYPGLILGEDMFKALDGRNLPSSGFMRQASQTGHELIPIIWCSAPPFGIVKHDAFEKIATIICNAIKNTNNLDAIYLDLHGGMISERYVDGEGELLKRIRGICGPNVPIAVSLDLHANVSKTMMNLADVIEVFRTSPHIDMARTGERVFKALNPVILEKKKYAKAFIKLPYILPLTSQCTLIEPASSIYAMLESLGTKHDIVLSFAMGNMLADTIDCGPSVLGFGLNESVTEYAVKELTNFIEQNIKKFKFNAYSAQDSVKQAMKISQSVLKPIVIADIQDNPNGGGTADTTGLLRALIDAKATDSILAILCDPEAALLAHESGVNSIINIGLGGKSAIGNDEPVCGDFKVIALGNGQYEGTGAYTLGTKFNLGSMALLEIKGVQVIISSKKMQAADPALFHHLNIDPSKKRILVLKSSINFRADFTEIASDIILSQAPGACLVDPHQLIYKNIPQDIQIL